MRLEDARRYVLDEIGDPPGIFVRSRNSKRTPHVKVNLSSMIKRTTPVIKIEKRSKRYGYFRFTCGSIISRMFCPGSETYRLLGYI